MFPITIYAAPSCPSLPVVILGSSLHPFIKDGESAYMQPLFCADKEIENGALISFYNNDRKTSLTKIVKGVPGDYVSQCFEGVCINGKQVLNSEGRAYTFSDIRKNIIKENSGIIPERKYFVLGDVTNGTDDSSKLGLINFNSINQIGRKATSKELPIVLQFDLKKVLSLTPYGKMQIYAAVAELSREFGANIVNDDPEFKINASKTLDATDRLIYELNRKRK